MGEDKIFFKWLHLSDIHFSNSIPGFNTQELRDKLPKYLKDTLGGEIYNCMVISGDFRYAPDNVDNETNIVEYIQNLAKATGISEDKIILVPGNHDLKRSDERQYIVDGVRNNYNPNIGNIKCITSLADDFDFFYKIQNKLGIKKTNSISNNPHEIVNMGHCYLLLINTSLTAYGDNDAHNLIVGTQYLQSLVSTTKDLKKPIILVGHHGLELLNEEEKQKCLAFFEEKEINLYLCGHSHEYRIQKHGNVVQATAGCMKQDNNDVDAAFLIGELHSDGTVKIFIHKWDSKELCWKKEETKKGIHEKLYNIPDIDIEDDPEPSQMVVKIQHPFSISKFERIPPHGTLGVKYIWEKAGHFVESATFNKRLTESQSSEDDNVSAYSISTSIGCILSAMNCECKFCETGKIGFKMPLTAEDIALQCIFGALYDKDCADHPEVHNHKREFAFMGQGEPGFHYDAVKKAILLNDIAMEKLNQNVYRYIISTFGNSDFLSSLILDSKKGVFNNKVSVHFSLHINGNDRDKLMPINKHYNYHEFIKLCAKYSQITKEKIGVGILLFKDFTTADNTIRYNLTPKKLKSILNELDSNVFRIDMCAMNKTTVGEQNEMGEAAVRNLLNIVEAEGFEYKHFSSFGDNIKLGCGMLSSNIENAENAGDGTIRVFNEAVRLLKDAKKEYDNCISNTSFPIVSPKQR